jgi:OmcA/MtrC family decaheme c-type cytochrome
MATNGWMRRAATVAAALAVAGLFAGACGDDDDDNNNPGDGDGNGTPTSPTGNEPGSGIDSDPLNFEIQSVTWPAEAGGRPVVTFRVTGEDGAPIDVAQEVANLIASPRAIPNISPRFTLAMLDDNGDYISYYETTRNPAAYTFTPVVEEGGEAPTLPTPMPMTQATATSAPTAAAPWTAEDLVSKGNGVWDLRLPAPTAGVEGLDPTKTHTVAGWVVRNTSRDSDVAFDSFNFVPSGGGTPQLDETITDAGCNKCHGIVQAHGTRRGTQLCLTCHSPQTGDPETARTVDFKVMIHKIHSGRDLPSVNQGNPYFIVGNGQSIHDWSNAAFPWHDGVSHCTACHQGEDQDNWKTKASLAACSSCHDNVKFRPEELAGLPSCSAPLATGQNWFDDCAHPDVTGVGPLENPQTCQTCHNTGALATDQFHHGDRGP